MHGSGDGPPRAAARPRKGRADAAPASGEIDEAVAAVRALLAEAPLLLLHDQELPSVTRLVAGEPVSGSWWAHPRGALIFHALERIGDEVAWPKLVRGKVTLVARGAWPALAAIGRAEEPWQVRGLPREARDLLALVAAAGGHARTDRLRETLDGRVVGRAVDQLERRLLVASEQVHTPDGKHARELSSWPRWLARRGLAGTRLPPVDEARALFEAAVGGWPGGASLLPWS